MRHFLSSSIYFENNSAFFHDIRLIIYDKFGNCQDMDNYNRNFGGASAISLDVPPNVKIEYKFILSLSSLF
jgi:hypothetical protein